MDTVYCMPKVAMVVSLADFSVQTSPVQRVANETFEPPFQSLSMSEIVVVMVCGCGDPMEHIGNRFLT
jgi:hypothetical protein